MHRSTPKGALAIESAQAGPARRSGWPGGDQESGRRAVIERISRYKVTTEARRQRLAVGGWRVGEYTRERSAGKQMGSRSQDHEGRRA